MALNGIEIISTGSAVPERIVTNDDFAKIVDTSDEWITTRTGMKKRHISSGEPTWFIGAKAAKNALEKGGVDPSEIDLIICTTVTPDFQTPSTACMIQRELGAENAMCFDMNAACTGFVFALDAARRYLSFPDCKTALIVSAEVLSKMVDYTDRASCVLFGDAAGACVVRAADKLYASSLSSDGNGAKLLCARYQFRENPLQDKSLMPEFDDLDSPHDTYLHMAGREVYKFATKALPNEVTRACERAEIEVSELSCIVPHQANVRIVETAAKNLGVSMDCMYMNLEKYGNTSSASIPVALDEAVSEGRIKRGDKIALVGFGGGLTSGAIVMEW